MLHAYLKGKPKPGGYVGRAKLQFNADHKYMDDGAITDKCWKLESDVCDWVSLPSTDESFGQRFLWTRATKAI